MIRLVIKLAIVALIANATWRLGTAYTSFYRFKDAAHEAVQFGGDRSEDQLRQRILRLAEQFDLPVAEDHVTVRREPDRTSTTGSFTRPVQLLPGYTYPWQFTWNIEVLNIDLRKAPPSFPQ